MSEVKIKQKDDDAEKDETAPEKAPKKDETSSEKTAKKDETSSEKKAEDKS